MIRGLRWAAFAAILMLAPIGAAKAQFYPGGYGGMGWGGWGGASTAQGDQARGLGVLAAGAGVYNVQTAQANAINSQTLQQWNEYIYACQDEHNRRNAARMAAQRKLVNETADTTLNRLRNNPTQSDIFSGNALNVALNEVMNPRVYTKALLGGRTKFAGTKIREIPFQYAAAALTLSVDDLLQNSPPKILDEPEFAVDRAGLKEIRAKLRESADKEEDFDPKLIAAAKAHIKSLQATLAANPDNKYGRGSRAMLDATNYLKGLYGLVTMLEGPAINVVLAGVENRPDTTVGDLLGFMQAFNLRFGVANTPNQRMVYTELWGILDGLRDEVTTAGILPPATRPANPSAAFFSGMGYEHLDAKRTPPTPPAPSAGKP